MTSEPNDDLRGISRLREIMARLRAPDGGCPWDIEQNFATIAPYTIEEAYEVADAIERLDIAALKDELGDLLFQVVYHAQMAQEEGDFNFDDVVDAICDKMIRRHPHVFGDANVETASDQTVAWEAQKARERADAVGEIQPPSALDGVAMGYPALLRAEKLQKRAARVGFDWPETAGALEKLEEELGEFRHELQSGGTADAIEDEFADVLFSMVNVARKLEIDAEAALRRGNAKFERRFRWLEEQLRNAHSSPAEADLEEMEMLWQRSKSAEAK